MDKKNLKEIINADLYRYYGKISFKIFLKSFFLIPAFRYTYFLRKCSFYREKKLKIKYYFFYFILRRFIYKFGYEIPPACKIGKGLYIGHHGIVRFNPDVEIGCNVNIGPGVIIGPKLRGKNKGVPKIGNYVWIGTDAFIVGNIKIGNNVLIAPKAYVTFNVPDNAVVIGNPGKIVSYKGTEGYINHIIK